MSITLPDPTPVRPRPVLIAGAVTFILEGLLAAFALLFGWEAKITAAFAVPIGGLVPLASALWAQRHVTPIKDPRDNDGNPLTPDPSFN